MHIQGHEVYTGAGWEAFTVAIRMKEHIFHSSSLHNVLPMKSAVLIVHHLPIIGREHANKIAKSSRLGILHAYTEHDAK